jgi:hypothetical protein
MASVAMNTPPDAKLHRLVKGGGPGLLTVTVTSHDPSMPCDDDSALPANAVTGAKPASAPAPTAPAAFNS